MNYTIALLTALLLQIPPTPTDAAAEAKHEVVTNSIGMKLVRIEAGSFRMGQEGPQADYRMMKHPERFDEADWDERPVHRVTISKPFFMGRTEVTNAQYEQFDPTHAKLRKASPCSRAEEEAVVNVSWEDAVKFCGWLSAKEKKTYRLPTEAEWEYACRAGTTTLFNLGDRLPDGFTTWLQSQTKCLGFFQKPFSREYRVPPGKEPLRVAQTPANAWGLYDMHGNVEEWCSDWYGPYESGEQTDPVGRSEGDFRVTRGGSHSQWVRLLRSANRSARIPTQCSVWTGFRVVQADPPGGTPLPPVPPPLCKRDVSQKAADLKPVDADKPLFQGPRVFVKIAPGSLGPLFSKHNHSPAIAECANGDLLAVWYSCVEEQGSEMCVAASRLRLGAAEWEDASPFYDVPDVNDHYPKLWFDGDKTLYFFVAGLVHNNLLTSRDNGATWSKPQPIYPLGEVGNQAFRTREGFIVQPHDSPSSFIISRDEGRTWTYQHVEKRAAGTWPTAKKGNDGQPLYDAFAEPGDCRPGKTGVAAAGIHVAMAQLKDGSLLGIGRYDKPDLQDRFHGHAPISVTTDWGKTWTYRESEFPVVSSGQRAVLLRLREGPLMYCSFTERSSQWKNRQGMTFDAADGGRYTGYGLFAALSLDEGRTWPVRRLVTDGGAERTHESTDGTPFKLIATMAEPFGYLAATQTRDGRIQLISSRNHYVFNLAWLKQRPPAPTRNGT